jgi:hypothetical protein
MSEEIKDEATTTWAGTVTDVGFPQSGGMYVRIERKFTAKNGQEYSTKATAWDITNEIISVGDRIKVSGLLSVKGSLYKNRNGEQAAGAEVNINKAQIIARGARQPIEQVIPVEEDSWATAVIPSAEDTPF